MNTAKLLTSSLLGTALLLGVSVASEAAEPPFDDCGVLVPGVTCPLLFQSDHAGLYILENLGSFHLGDHVHVVGTLDSGCISICQQGNGCIFQNTIAACLGAPGTPICFGDGTGTPCPCANNGAAGHGCANSVNPSGALLDATGMASVSADTLVLAGSDMPNATALYFQGTSALSGGMGIQFGDGLRCPGGAIIRLGIKTNVSGASQYPVAGDPSVSVRGLDHAGDVRVYQAWYRNAATFCTTATYNLSNGVQVTWGS